MTVIAEIATDADVQHAVTDADTGRLANVASFVGAMLFGSGEFEIGVRLVSDATIGALHDEWFGDPSPTDVITFPAHNDGVDAPDGYLGDIVISVDTAEAAAVDEGWTLARELAFILVHGLLHLAGWDDATTDDREAMLAEGARLLGAFEAAHGDMWAT